MTSPAASNPIALALCEEGDVHVTIPTFLSRAIEAVLDAWPDDSTYRDLPEVRCMLEAVARIAIQPDGLADSPEARTAVEEDRILLRRLLQCLSMEVVQQSHELGVGERPEAVLETLWALEQFRRSTLPKDAGDFASRFAEPDGFELLVEVAHDLRSPLTSITFLAETLRAGHSGEVNLIQENQLGLIWSAAFGMTSVFSDIMDLAKERAGISDDPSAPFSIRGVFEEIEQMVGPMVEVKGLELVFSPPLHEQVIGNEVALFRVLLNLTTNAIKFTEEGSVEVEAETLDRALVRFSVRDTGRGIGENGLKTLFSPFKKAGNRGGYFFSGSGLGLTIARRYIRAMASELQLETRPGWGTRFFFDLRLPPAGEYR
jgi:signal transduction histidine kinase